MGIDVDMYIRFYIWLASVCTSISIHWMKMHMRVNLVETSSCVLCTLYDDDYICEVKCYVRCVG